MLSKHIGWCGAVLMSLAQAPDSAALPPPSEISAPAATAKATKPADVQVKKFPGSPTQVTPARPSDAKSIVPKAKRLDERALRGLRLVMSGAVVDIRQLPLYFDSPQDVVDVMYTAVAVKAAGEAQRNAGFSKSKKQAALTNTVKVLKDGGLSHLDEAELLRMYNSLPEIGIKPAKLNAPKAKFSVREASYYSVSTRTTPGHIDWHGLGSFLTCQAPLAEGGSGFELGAGFTWWINVPYPCGIDFDWFNSSIEWCDYWVPIKVGVTLGCNCGFQVDCCGAAVWGECYGEACIGVCAGCSAGLALGAGGLSSSTDGSICAYGIPVVASASCQFAGITIWSDAINVSPYAVTGPCPVPGMCATP